MSDEKYLDSEQNPFILVSPESPRLNSLIGEGEEDGAIPDDRDVLAPFEPVPGPEATPERLAERLRESFPNQYEIEIDKKIRIVRSAAGGFITDRGIPLGDLSGSERMKISDFLQNRMK